MKTAIRQVRDRSSRFAVAVLLAGTILAFGGYCFGAEPPASPGVTPLKIRAFMADAPRTPESFDYYKRLIDFLSDWGFNALVFRLTDDQGVAIRFESHPEFLTHKDALTTAQVKELVAYGQKRGIELIPEIESFGHSKFITSIPQKTELADNDPNKPDKRSFEFSGLIPSHPKVLQLIGDIYREAAALFPSKYFHGGCDEVAWGDSPYTQKRLKTMSRAQIWAQYINDLNAIARKAGKEFIIWADHPLNEDPQILALLDKNIILNDWDYTRTDPKVVEVSARKVLDSGRRVIGAPSLIYCRWGPRANTDQLRDLDAYSDAYRSIDDPRNLGVLVTNWVPSRYIQGSIWDGIAYAGIALSEGSVSARRDALKRFVERHYGAVWNETWADIFESYYAAAPYRKGCSQDWTWPRLPIPWRSKEELVEVVRGNSTYSPPFTRILSLLNFVEPQVRTNLQDFRAFRLSLNYLEQLFWRNTVLVQEASSGKLDKKSAANLIQAIAERDRFIYEQLSAEWDQGRPPDSQLKTKDIYNNGNPGEQLVFSFGQAAKYSAELAKNPDAFLALLQQGRTQSKSSSPSLSAMPDGTTQACTAAGEESSATAGN
jgi:hypothetical protein